MTGPEPPRLVAVTLAVAGLEATATHLDSRDVCWSGETGDVIRIAPEDAFLDTMVICSLTAFTVLVTGAWTEGTSTEMTVRAFNAAVPWFGGLIVALSSLLFGFSSLVAAPYYGETALTYLFGAHIKVPFRWAFCVLILAGSLVEVEFAWSLGDVLNGLMTVSNLVGLIGLSGVAVGAVKGYLASLSIEACLTNERGRPTGGR